MAKAPGRVTDIPVRQVRNSSRANAQVRVLYENAFVDKIGHVDASNSNCCIMSTNKDI